MFYQIMNSKKKFYLYSIIFYNWIIIYNNNWNNKITRIYKTNTIKWFSILWYNYFQFLKFFNYYYSNSNCKKIFKNIKKKSKLQYYYYYTHFNLSLYNSSSLYKLKKIVLLQINMLRLLNSIFCSVIRDKLPQKRWNIFR